MRKMTVYFIMSQLCGLACAQNIDCNYIRHDIMLDYTGNRKTTEVRYHDGLGRVSLLASNAVSTNGTYLHTLSIYDTKGREKEKWLPIPGGSKPDYITESEFKSRAQTFYGDSYAYVQKSYDGLDRAVSSYGAGKAWHDAGKDSKTTYGTNNAEEVKRYDAPCDGTFRLVEDGYYAKGTLYVETASDEDGHSLAVYVDLHGRKVLERRGGNNDTYYVYDDLGNLRFVLSPEYQNSKNLTGLYYEYRYDGRHRCTWKRLPGCEPVEYWYDRGDRIVCFRDGELRADGLFRFFLYDKLGRLSVQGLCTSCATGENDIPVVSYTPVFSGFGGSLYQIPAGKAQPQNAEIELVNYYDNHSFLNFNGFHKKDACYNILNGGSSTNARNQLTGTVMRSSDGSMLCSVTHYDDKYRPSDVRRTYADGVAVVMTTEYSFTGKPLTVQYTVYKDGVTIPVTIENTYGASNDLLVSSVLKTNGGETVLASNEYDGLGRLSKVTRGGGTLHQQYSYNVRGWLTQITGNGFREELYYTDGTVPCYNGDISRVKWDNNVSYPVYNVYDFGYDNLDRLASAKYTFYAGSALNFNNSEYFTYNSNGSPLTLKRYGVYEIYSHSGYDLINNLSFTYSGNQLQSVGNTGAFSHYASPYVFHKNTATDIGYAYNSNGSMTRNPDRHIGLIEYDSFNNPCLIQFTDGSVTEYVYDASGTKLKTLHRTAVPGIEVPYGTVYEHTASTVLSSDSTLYAGPFVLSGDSLRYKYDGGSVLIPLDGSPVKPCFYALDHLGSVRLVVSADGQVIERNDYYPSGCMITGNITNEGNIQPYKYNGKELDPMHGLYTYDYGARQYDPATILWDRMDPLDEDNPEVSPYVFCGDNPISYVDNNGMEYMEYDQNNKKISNLGGNEFDFYHLENHNTKVVNRKSGMVNIIKGGERLIRNYAHRTNDTTISQLTSEFLNETGPEKSMFTDFNNSSKGPFESLRSFKSVYTSEARHLSLINKYEKKGYKSINTFLANPMTAGLDMWEQFIGEAGISWYDMGDSMLYILTDAKSNSSLLYHTHFFPNRTRNKSGRGWGNTYQTYIWTESKSVRNQKNEKMWDYIHKKNCLNTPY